MKEKGSKSILSWALYDWGNSAFSTTVMAGFFPIFFKQYWSQGIDAVTTTARLGTAISISSLFIALLSPTLGVIADLKGYKKKFCLFFTVTGALSCTWMGFLGQGEWQNAMFAYGLAMMSFNAASVFYDSLLPSVASPRQMDFASSLGYALGYLGGGVLFLLNVLMYSFPSAFGISDGVSAVKISFLMVAVWWLLFSIPLVRNVKEETGEIKSHNFTVLIKKSFATLNRTIRELAKEKNILTFIVAYWLYIDGVYTVMTMAVDFGISIGLEAQDLIAALLITQFVGFPAAYFFGKLTQRWGTRRPILFCIGVYSVTVIAAVSMSQAWHFYLLATVIGLVQGGVQSLSRSLFGRMIDKKKSGEYFGFFNLVGRFASILGPLVVAMGALITGNSRWGIAGLLVLFLLGGGLLLKVREPQHDMG